MYHFFKIIFLSCSLLATFTLHSTGIYISSLGQVRIHINQSIRQAGLNPHIIPGDIKLGSTLLVVTTPKEMKSVHIESACEHKESLLYSASQNERTTSIIQVNFLSACNSPSVRIGDIENVFTDTLAELPIEPLWNVQTVLINKSSEDLVVIMRKGIEIPQKWPNATIAQKLSAIQNLYENAFVQKQSDLARQILDGRENLTYISPIAGYSLPKDSRLVPGARRPYRIATTDGIHHGWDILAPYGTPVRSLAKGTVINIISDWKWSDFRKLKRGDLSFDDKLMNLNIYRGNQVWLQTEDGNVTFYSHLSKIEPDLAVGSEVGAGTLLGAVGISGVPDKNYRDIHLHFEIQKNPFAEGQKNPTALDIMRWDYLGKNESRTTVMSEMRRFFQ